MLKLKGNTDEACAMRSGPFAWGAAVLMLACQSPSERPVGGEKGPARCSSLQGEEVWEDLGASDPAVRRLVSARGLPDYRCEVDRGVHLVYLRRDETVTISKGPSASAGPTVHRRIPGELLDLLPAREKGRLEARRLLTEGRSRSKAPSRGAAPRAPTGSGAAPSRAPVPAALAPASDRFHVDALVATLSRTTSFGAAGLSDWRRQALVDGTVRATARDGQKLYELRADRVAVVVSFDPMRPHTIAGAALACRRLNEAIFPGDPQPANEATLELLYAVGTDSRQRRIERKVSGRTLTAQRVASGGQVLFAIHPR